MARMKYREAREKALAAGASQERIDQYAKSTFGGPVFKRNMIAALHMHPWHNTADDWARLAGALKPALPKVREMSDREEREHERAMLGGRYVW